MKSDPIQDHVLKSERNLRIAAAVGEAWMEAREKLVSGFLDRLETRMKMKLKGWTFVRWGGRFFVDAYPGYYCYKPGWEDQYAVALQCNEYGERMVFGVERAVHHIGKRRFCEPLLNAITELHPSATKQRWWEARVTMRSPSPDWRKPEVLWRMHKDKKFLDDVAEQLLDVAIESTPIIDRLVRKK